MWIGKRRIRLAVARLNGSAAPFPEFRELVADTANSVSANVPIKVRRVRKGKFGSRISEDKVGFLTAMRRLSV